MEPIISPWFFYFVDIADKIIVFSRILTFFLFVVGIFIFAITYNEHNEDSNNLKSLARKMIIAVPIFGLLSIFTPNSTTCYKMLITSYVTPNNIEIAVEKSDKAIEYIIEKIVETSQKLNKECNANVNNKK